MFSSGIVWITINGLDASPAMEHLLASWENNNSWFNTIENYSSPPIYDDYPSLILKELHVEDYMHPPIYDDYLEESLLLGDKILPNVGETAVVQRESTRTIIVNIFYFDSGYSGFWENIIVANIVDKLSLVGKHYSWISGSHNVIVG